ncbi:tryptophan synthase subunit beta, partial [Campylobacter jejuni]|nr:tryptophan synthase subunit beta [Campylobacter jejuni]
MKKAYYGDFGGQFLPESAMFALNELESAFLKFSKDKLFKKELNELLKTYVGRPTPLYFAR